MATQGSNKPTNVIPIEQVDQPSISSLLLLMAFSEIFQSPN